MLKAKYECKINCISHLQISAAAELHTYSNDLCIYFDEYLETNICEFGHMCVNVNEALGLVKNESVLYGATCEEKCFSFVHQCDEDYGSCLIINNGKPECM